MTVPSRNARLASHLLEISKSDLKASKYLFTGKFFCQAVFYLEQSVEKALKSFQFKFGMMTEEEAKSKEYGHKPHKVIVLVNSRLKEYFAYKKRHPSHPEEEKVINELEKFLSMLPDPKQSLSNVEGITKSPSIKEFQEIISVIKGWMDFESIKKERLINYGVISNLEVRERLISLDKLYRLGYVNIYKSLNALSVILAQHAVRSRYSDGLFNPLEQYNENLPLIEVFGELISITEQILQDLENLYTQFFYDNS